MSSIALQLIKSTDTEKVLNTLRDFYKSHNVDLKQERILDLPEFLPLGNETFKNFDAYIGATWKSLRNRHLQFTTNFLFAQDLDEAPGCTVLYYFLAGRKVLHPNLLSDYVSEKLQTQVIDMLTIEDSDTYIVRNKENGKTVDLFESKGLELTDAALGSYFERFAISDELPEDFMKDVFEFFRDKKLDWDDLALLNLNIFKQRDRILPLYLKGSPANLEKLMLDPR